MNIEQTTIPNGFLKEIGSEKFKEFFDLVMTLDWLKNQLGGKYNLENVPRRGWVLRDIVTEKTAQSVGEHSENMAFLLLIFLTSPQFKINADPNTVISAVSLALIHDLQEVITGDRVVKKGITPENQIAALEQQKKQDEKKALDHICGYLKTNGHERAANMIKSMLESYEEKKLPHEQYVKAVDIIEMWLQAIIYADLDSKKLIDFAKDTDSLKKAQKMADGAFAEIALSIFNDLRKKCGLKPTKNRSKSIF